MYKKILSIVVILTLCFTTNTFARNDYQELEVNIDAIVTKVYDAEAMEIKVINSGELANVKLIGLNSYGYEGGYEYVNNRLLGKKVLITYDLTVDTHVSDWNLVYMREGNDLINTKLIELGFAKAELSTSTDVIYNKYQKLQNSAKNNNFGIWEDKGLTLTKNTSENTSEYYYDTNTININTATENQLRNYLENISSTLARNIVVYRKNNPFNTISEIKFVDGMTKEIYDKNIRLMHVITNINKAKHTELSSLINITSFEADEIIKYRDKKGTIYLKNLVSDNIMSSYDLKDNEKFLSEKDENFLQLNEPEIVVNINTANKSQLTKAGLSSKNATTIIDLRDQGYSFKNIGELLLIENLSIKKEELEKLEDNLNVMTDLNSASKEELLSLFADSYSDVQKIINDRNFKYISDVRQIIGESKFNKIEPYIYVDNYSNDFININTATERELTDLGISSAYAKRIVDYSSIINDFSEIPVNLKIFDRNITLFTNINNASISELMSLDSEITTSIAEDIQQYSKKQPFGGYTEFKEFMLDKNLSNVFGRIDDFIVFR